MLRHLFNRLLLGDPYRLGYVQAGKGIARRRSSYRPEWDHHIAATKAAQRTWFEGLDSLQSLTVIGAGRLFDFNENLPNTLRRLEFVDADPNCQQTWKRFAKRHPQLTVQGHTLEISGKIYGWAAQFRQLLAEAKQLSPVKRWERALSELATLHLGPVSASKSSGLFSLQSDAVLSLNILSQIPIQWQMWVEQALIKAFGKRFVEPRESAWLKAIRPSCAQLVKEHLILLAAGGARTALLITDLDYVEYRLPPKNGVRVKNPALRDTVLRDTVLAWVPRADAPTNPESALFAGTWERDPNAAADATAEVYDSLYGLPLNDLRQLTQIIPQISFQPVSCWTWHIAPQFREHKEHGYLHRVGAIKLTAE